MFDYFISLLAALTGQLSVDHKRQLDLMAMQHITLQQWLAQDLSRYRNNMDLMLVLEAYQEYFFMFKPALADTSAKPTKHIPLVYSQSGGRKLDPKDTDTQ